MTRETRDKISKLINLSDQEKKERIIKILKKWDSEFKSIKSRIESNDLFLIEEGLKGNFRREVVLNMISALRNKAKKQKSIRHEKWMMKDADQLESDLKEQENSNFIKITLCYFDGFWPGKNASGIKRERKQQIIMEKKESKELNIKIKLPKKLEEHLGYLELVSKRDKEFIIKEALIRYLEDAEDQIKYADKEFKEGKTYTTEELLESLGLKEISDSGQI